MNNNLKNIDQGVFSDTNKLLWLFLHNNQIEKIYIEDFQYLSSVKWL